MTCPAYLEGVFFSRRSTCKHWLSFFSQLRNNNVIRIYLSLCASYCKPRWSDSINWIPKRDLSHHRQQISSRWILFGSCKVNYELYIRFPTHRLDTCFLTYLSSSTYLFVRTVTVSFENIKRRTLTSWGTGGPRTPSSIIPSLFLSRVTILVFWVVHGSEMFWFNQKRRTRKF